MIDTPQPPSKLPTNPTTCGKWRAEAERWRVADDSVAVQVWAPRVIALCDELDAADSALAAETGHIATLRCHVDALERKRDVANAEVKRLKANIIKIKGLYHEDRERREELKAEVERLRIKTQGDDAWIAVAVESNKAITTYLRSAAPDLDDPGGMPVDRVRRVVESLRRDAERLDWLEGHNVEILHMTNVATGEHGVEMMTGWVGVLKPTVRDAIDAAIAQARKQHDSTAAHEQHKEK